MQIKPGSRSDFERFMQKQAELYASHVEEIYGLPSNDGGRPHFVEVPILMCARNLSEPPPKEVTVQRMVFMREKITMFGKYLAIWVRVE